MDLQREGSSAVSPSPVATLVASYLFFITLQLIFSWFCGASLALFRRTIYGYKPNDCTSDRQRDFYISNCAIAIMTRFKGAKSVPSLMVKVIVSDPNDPCQP